MRFRSIKRAGLARLQAAGLALLGFAALATPAAAGRLDYLFDHSRVHNDREWYLNLTVAHSGYPPNVIEPIVPRVRNLETELPVVLFVARESGRPPLTIVELRNDGHSWAAIFERVDVPYRVLFADIERDPGPPYGRAWGYWKKHPRDFRLDDGDIVGLVHVQTARRVTGASAYEIARARGEGRAIETVVAERKSHPGRGAPETAARQRGKPRPGTQAFEERRTKESARAPERERREKERERGEKDRKREPREPKKKSGR